MNVDYDIKMCPYCGGEVRDPTIGEVTRDKEAWNRFLDDENYCLLYEKIDESGGTIGYGLWCKER